MPYELKMNPSRNPEPFDPEKFRAEMNRRYWKGVERGIIDPHDFHPAQKHSSIPGAGNPDLDRRIEEMPLAAKILFAFVGLCVIGYALVWLFH